MGNENYYCSVIFNVFKTQTNKSCHSSETEAIMYNLGGKVNCYLSFPSLSTVINLRVSFQILNNFDVCPCTCAHKCKYSVRTVPWLHCDNDVFPMQFYKANDILSGSN